MGATESLSITKTKMNRIALLSGQDPRRSFESLMHHFNEESLKECFYELDGKKAVGVDGVNKETYGIDLDQNIPNLIPFDKRLVAQGVEQGTFDFLGFTFYWGKARSGRVVPKLKTKAKTMRSKLMKVKEWIKQIKDRMSLKKIWKIFTAKLRGHVNYYGVSHNAENVSKFLNEAKKIVF